MIVLDTNVVSELMRPDRTESVARWFMGRAVTTLCTTAVTQAEILFGAQLLPKGKRRDGIEQAAGVLFDKGFEGRVLPFDSEAARAYARIVASPRRSGRPISQADAQIAAIARSLDFDLATRNVSDFEGCGIEVHDPWRG
jgi:predicted nucleic acid-binding protein